MIKLEKISEKHKEGLIRILNKSEIEKWLVGPPFPYTNEDADLYIQKCKDNRDSKNDFPFAIELDKVHIGGIGLHRIKDLQEGFVGYYIDDAYWRKSYATIALNIILDFAFEDLKFERVSASVFIGNAASEKLLQKCGFKFKEFKENSHSKNVKSYSTNLFVKEKTNLQS